MSDVVVSVVESNTAVTVTEQDVAVDVTENNVIVSVSTAGIQGVPGANNDPTYVTVRNNTGATLAKGTIVYISGANGNNVQVTPAIATGDSTSARTIGWLAASIPNNGSGLCMVEGYLEGINTQGFTAGAQLYLSGTTVGAFTATKPQAPIHLVYVGVVTKVSAGDGHVFVKVQNGYELSELHDVQIINPTNAQVLAYDSATQLWKNATNAPDGVTSITATAPLTGGTITSTGSIGLDQTALSITKSQVSDFTSGTVTSASTAQQSGTAVFANTSGTATYATTSGTAVTISGDITKSQVSDFTSGTVASAGTAQQAGTAVFANTSGTATFATTSGTAVTISGSITQSQVTNLTTDLAGKANLAGGNAFTGAQTISTGGTANKGLVVQGVASQAVNLFEVQDSTGAFRVRVNQVGNSTFAGNITSQNNALFTPFSAATVPLTVQGAASQTASILSLQNSAGSITANFTAPVNNVNRLNLGGTDLSATLGITVHASGGVGQVIRGAASQSVDLLQLQNSAGVNQFRVDQGGMAVANALGVAGSPSGISYAFFTTPVANAVPVVIRGAASQTSDLFDVQNSSAVDLFSISSAGLITAKVVGNAANQSRGLLLSNTADTWQSGLYLRSDASGFPRLSLLAPTGALGEAVSIDSAAKVGIGNIAPVAQLDVYSQLSTRVGAVIRGAASQTANLLEIQSSAGAVLSRFESTGNLVVPGTSGAISSGTFILGSRNSGAELTMVRQTTATANPGANLARLYFRDGTTAGTLKLVVRAGAAGAETTILDNIPQ